MIHFVIWKFIIIKLTENAHNGTPVNGDVVLDRAKRRIHTRIGKAIQEVRERQRKADAQGEEQPKLDQVRSWLKGIGNIDDDGNVMLIDKLKEWLYSTPP